VICYELVTGKHPFGNYPVGFYNLNGEIEYDMKNVSVLDSKYPSAFQLLLFELLQPASIRPPLSKIIESLEHLLQNFGT